MSRSNQLFGWWRKPSVGLSGSYARSRRLRWGDRLLRVTLSSPDKITAGPRPGLTGAARYPRQDSNLCFRLRRPTLYPLSYGGSQARSTPQFMSLPSQQQARTWHTDAPSGLIATEPPFLLGGAGRMQSFRSRTQWIGPDCRVFWLGAR